MKRKFIKVFLFCILIIRSTIYGQIITTIAGGSTGAGLGDGGPATAARIGYTGSIAVDDFGNVFIADGNNQRVRKVDAATGIISTVAGNGTMGYNGDSILATNAELNDPDGVSIDPAGNLYISEASFRIRKVDAVTGIITTFVGIGIQGFSGDNGPATAAKIVGGLTSWDALGNMYLGDNNRIRKIDMTGTIITIAGTGIGGCAESGVPATSATFNNVGVCADASGNIYFNSFDSCVSIYRIDAATGFVTRVAGTNDRIGIPYSGDGGQATATHIYPLGIAVDTIGNLYIADYENQRIEKVNTSGIIQTIAGIGIAGFSGDGGLATVAKINYPEGVALDKCGNVYIADFNNKRIRKVTFDSTCSYGSDTTHTDTTNAVQNIKSGGFSVYPNPATTEITVTGSSINDVQVINMLGEVVYDKAFMQQKKITIDISSLPNGVYFVKVNPASGGTVVEKVVKE